jgi:hypothetical protein
MPDTYTLLCFSYDLEQLQQPVALVEDLSHDLEARKVPLCFGLVPPQ